MQNGFLLIFQYAWQTVRSTFLWIVIATSRPPLILAAIHDFNSSQRHIANDWTNNSFGVSIGGRLGNSIFDDVFSYVHKSRTKQQCRNSTQSGVPNRFDCRSTKAVVIMAAVSNSRLDCGS